MKKISVPLAFKPNSTVVLYPGQRDQWSDARVEQDRLIGNYSGALYAPNSATKAFDWDIYADPVINYGTVMSTVAYLRRFTLDEKATIELESVDDPSATKEVRLQKARIRQVLKMLDFESEIDLANPDFQSAALSTCMLLQEAGAITNAEVRYNELIGEPVTFNDLPERLKPIYLK